MTESMCDIVEAGGLPEGWTARNGMCIESPHGTLLMDYSGDLLDGTYVVHEEIPADPADPFPNHRPVAEIRTDDPRIAIAAAVAIDGLEP